jgi:hypothetical protein
LIEILQKENDLSEKRLKAIFRRLCKKTHPDALPGRSMDFIQLRKEYEEALRFLRTGADVTVKTSAGKAGIRDEILRQLYFYTVKEVTTVGEDHLLKLISLLKKYKNEVSIYWQSYHQVFFKTSGAWVSDGTVYYAHSLIMSIIKQMFYYFSKQSSRHKILFEKYIDELGKIVKKLDSDRARILLDITRWLKDEIEVKGPVMT